MDPLRSCRRKLKPEAAPNPAKVGTLNGKMTASGMAANWPASPAMMPFTCRAALVRSSHGFRRAKSDP